MDFSNVRDGRLVHPYCTLCGCRLKIKKVSASTDLLTHFYHEHFAARDGRRHSCKNLGKMFYTQGSINQGLV